MTEFPAAHSMDTDWYAVDKTGHVARLSSGEEGAVPNAAHRQYWQEFHEELIVARFDPTIRGIFMFDPEMKRIGIDDLPSQWSGILRFSSPEFRELYVEEWKPKFRLLDPTSIVVETIHPWEFRDYYDADTILATFATERVPDPNVLGMYEYSCSFSGPYHLDATPRDPARIDDFPSAVRGKLAALRIDKITFGVTASFDPDRFLACYVYGR